MEKSTQNFLEKLKAATKPESPEAERKEKEERVEWLKQYKLREEEVSQALLALPVGAFVRYQWSLGFPISTGSYWKDGQTV
jgi:hypothetical protein